MKNSRVFKTSLIYFISAFLFLLLKLFSELHLFDFLGTNKSLIINAFIQIGLMFIIPLALYFMLFRKTPKKVFSKLQFRKVSFATVLLSFLTGFVMFICVIIISTVCASVLSMIGYRSPFSGGGSVVGGAGSIWTLLILPTITTAILPGFCEEFINRGILMQGLTEISPRKAILISALCFGLLHYNINQAIYAVFVGIVLGSVTYFSKSIFPAMIIHFMNNFCSTFFSFAQSTGTIGKNFYNILDGFFTGSFFSVFVKFMLLTIVAFVSLAYCLHFLFKSTQANRIHQNLKLVAEKYMGTPEENKNGALTYGMEESANKQAYEGEVFVKMKDSLLKDVYYESSPYFTFIDKFVPNVKPNKIRPLDKIFLHATIVMTGALTLFTVIWGLL